MQAYEQHHYDKELLKQSAENLGNIELNPIADLEQVRKIINKLCDEEQLSQDWCFVDCKFHFIIDFICFHMNLRV